MIGTCREVLYALSLRFRWNKDMPLTSMQKRNLTRKIRSGAFGERLCARVLPYFGAIKIREPYILPALYINDSGKIIDEETLKEIVTSTRKWHGGRFSDNRATRIKHSTCCNLDEVTMNYIASCRGYKRYKNRITFPSIWELKQDIDARYFPKVNLNEYSE